jgi:16S rRNA (uracil1498-N3)-methyltransferase
MPYFFCPTLDTAHKTVTLTAEELHHLVHVLRHKPGDEIYLNSGNGLLARGIIDSIGKSSATVSVTECSFSEHSAVPFAIAFSLLRNRNDELLVEKATELGVKDLFPFVSINSVRNPSHNTINRFRNSTLSAIKQCGNPYLPIIHDIVALEKLFPLVEQKGYTLVAASEGRPDIWIDNLEKGIPYCFLIGPEGGFSPDEFQSMKQSGILEVSLSGLILRAETAAITAAAQVSLLNRQI